MPTYFKQECRTCEQTERVEAKHEDPAFTKLTAFVQRIARQYHLLAETVWSDLNHVSLLADIKVALQPGATCKSCTHEFLNERDIQFDHREPPRRRDLPDLARLHARNVTILCASCNNTKNNASYAQWLDNQEDARLAAFAIHLGTAEFRRAISLVQYAFEF